MGIDAETWAQIAEQFTRLREVPLADRAPLLAALHPTVRQEVESLLAADQSAGGFLQQPESRLLGPGAHLGPYRILREIGSGGMGIVYLAERSDGEFSRKVAIKITGGRLFAPEAERRFIHERQILAQLDHPNIVRLLDGGISEGRRYFVMEFVEGESLTTHAKALPILERLKLFLHVCSAVHYAHQRLVIHRDLKSANVLVTRDGAVKLLDFGVAQILDDSLAVDGHDTVLHPLSLACASPEQLRGGRVTLATDIYSLGVLLYELIAGRDPQYEKGASHAETVRRVTEIDPPSPSLVDSSIHPDLSAITLKALAKSPKDRYNSAAEFRADLERYLEGRPVLAIPPRPLYLAARFVLRNKALTATAATLVLSLLAGAVYFYRQSRIEAYRYQHAHQLVRTLIFDVHPKLDGMAGTLPLRKTLIAGTIHYLEALAQNAVDDVPLLQELSRSYLHMARLQGNSWSPNLGQLPVAFEQARKAEDLLLHALHVAPSNHRLFRDAAILYSERAELDLLNLRNGEAAAHSQKALQYAGQYAAYSPGDWDARRILAHATYHRANSIAGSNPDQAILLFRKALDHFRRLYKEKPAEEEMLVYSMLGEWRIAETALANNDFPTGLIHARKGLATAEQVHAKDPRYQRYRLYLSSGILLLSYAYTRTHDFSSAIPLIERAIAIRERILMEDPNNAQAKERLAGAYRALSQAQLNLRRYRQAYTSASKGGALYAELQAKGGLVPLFVSGYADTLLVLAQAAQAMGKREESCSAGKQAIKLFLDYRKATPYRDSIDESIRAVRALSASCP